MTPPTREQLASIEWSGTLQAGRRCPACYNHKDEGHWADCWLSAALAPAPEPAPMPALAVGDWVLTTSSVLDRRAVIITEPIDHASTGTLARITEIRGIRNGVPFVWQRQPGDAQP